MIKGELDMNKYLNNNKGGALVLTLLVLVVLSILGVSLLDLSLAETKFVQHQQNRAQAHYIAHSSADALATYLIKNPENLSTTDLNSYINTLRSGSNTSPTNFTGGGSYVVTTANSGANNLKITATGTFNNVNKAVSVILIKRGLFDNAIYAHRSLTLWSGAKVYGGDVQYGETIYMGNNAGVVNGDVNEGPLDYPENEFPEPPETLEPNIILTPHQTLVMNSSSNHFDKEYDIIDVSNHGTLTIDVGTTTQKIVVRSMTINGTLNVIGTGKLILYVREEVFFKGIINNSPENLIVYIGDYNSETNTTGYPGYIELKTGNSIFNGYIVGLSATIDITANLVYTGAIIADTVKVASNAEVYYDAEKAATLVPEEIYLPPLGYKIGEWSN
jgi:type II secretory pathway pseudopilin PulG